MAYQDINKKNVEGFIEKYINKIVNKKYEGIIPVEIVEFQWFGKNLIVYIHMSFPPKEWDLNKILKFWKDLTDVGQYAKAIDYNLNSINFMPEPKNPIR